jgi:putative oxidoreductase
MVFLLARVLFLAIFVTDLIFNKWMHASRSKALMVRFKMPFPSVVLGVSIVFEIAASLMILFNFYAFYAAFALFLFLLGATPIFHRFWKEKEIGAKQNELNHFMKNVSIMGGCLFLMILMSAAA